MKHHCRSIFPFLFRRRCFHQGVALSLGLVLLLLFFFFPATASASGKNDIPSAYHKARERLEAVTSDPVLRLRRDVWLSLHDAFMGIYRKHQKWNNRAAARYRAGLALEELARWSGRRQDALAAIRHFTLFAADHSTSVLADDALFHKAGIQRRAGKRNEALASLEDLLKRYPQGDMAAKARREITAVRGGLLVLLDAGHGGRDPGTAHHGIVEKHMALDLTRRIGRELSSRGIRVAYTRTRDIFLTLAERCDMVRQRQADLFISIHINATANPAIAGFETYVLEPGRGTTAARLAAIENAFQGRRNALQAASSKSRLQEQLKLSRKLAELVQQGAVHEVRRRGFSTEDRGVLTAPFFVLREAGVPAVLVEVGYCTNRQEARRLTRSIYRQRLADGIAQGIHDYMREIDSQVK